MLFAKAGEFSPCGIFTSGHIILIIATIICIVWALKNTVRKNEEEIHKIIKSLTVTMIILEILRICLALRDNSLTAVNKYLPLYYCSLLLYAGIFSSFAKGKLKRIGDVFLATGGIIGGIVFTIMPTTSLPTYPMLHFVSLHSFLFHGIMIYLGLLINITGYIKLNKKDIIYFSTLVGVICIIAYIVNCIFDSNLMFISKNFPGTPIELIYNLTGPMFTLIMIICQMTLPFYIVYGIVKLKEKIKIEIRIKEKNNEILENN